MWPLFEIALIDHLLSSLNVHLTARLSRIPFAAANLNAALNGIRANPGAIYVAFLFQLIALTWSVYFVYVTVGVYDAMNVDVDLSDKMKVLVYAALGLSYYWTLQVFLVSDGGWHGLIVAFHFRPVLTPALEHCPSDSCRSHWKLVVRPWWSYIP